MGGGEQRLVIGLVHGREHGHQVRGLSAHGCKGIPGHRPGVDMPGMWGDDGHHLAGKFRQLGPVKVLIDRTRKSGRVAFVPCTGQRRWTNRCNCCHRSLLVRYYFSTEGHVILLCRLQFQEKSVAWVFPLESTPLFNHEDQQGQGAE